MSSILRLRRKKLSKSFPSYRLPYSPPIVGMVRSTLMRVGFKPALPRADVDDADEMAPTKSGPASERRRRAR
jgi:hypothetical protein